MRRKSPLLVKTKSHATTIAPQLSRGPNPESGSGSENIVILYNTIVGLAAGVGLILVAELLQQFADGEKVQPEGFALASGIAGFIQTVLGLRMWRLISIGAKPLGEMEF